MALDPYTRLNWRGVVANRRTIEMAEITELRSLGDLAPLSIPQGSYSTAVSQSGNTHAGGGALDISVRGMTADQRQHVVWALRKTGFAAWYRTPAQGFVYHIHAIAIGDKEMSSAAAQQVAWYRQGLNGLWPPKQGPDDGPDVPITVYRQDVDMSYYGPEKWDDADFDRFRKKVGWLDNVPNLNTEPASQIDAETSQAWTHKHANLARKAAESADKKLDDVLKAVTVPPVPPV